MDGINRRRSYSAVQRETMPTHRVGVEENDLIALLPAVAASIEGVSMQPNRGRNPAAKAVGQPLLERLACLGPRVVKLACLGGAGYTHTTKHQSRHRGSPQWPDGEWPTCPMTIGPAPIIMIVLRSLRFLISLMAEHTNREAISISISISAAKPCTPG